MTSGSAVTGHLLCVEILIAHYDMTHYGMVQILNVDISHTLGKDQLIILVLFLKFKLNCKMAGNASFSVDFFENNFFIY